MKRISVIIPTYRRGHRIGHLLDSLSMQDMKSDDFEVLVVSNFDDELTRKATERFPNFKYFVVGRLGVNFARNLGIHEARGQILYFVDDDCVLGSASILSQLAKNFNENSEIAALGGPYLMPEKANLVERAYFFIADQWLRRGIISNRGETRYLIGGNCAFAAAKIQGRYFFDEEITFGGSEVGIFRRLFAAGEKILFVESLGILHFNKVNIFQFFKKAYRQGMGAKINALNNRVERRYYADLTAAGAMSSSKNCAFGIRMMKSLYSFAFRIGNNLDPEKRLAWQRSFFKVLFSSLFRPFRLWWGKVNKIAFAQIDMIKNRLSRYYC